MHLHSAEHQRESRARHRYQHSNSSDDPKVMQLHSSLQNQTLESPPHYNTYHSTSSCMDGTPFCNTRAVTWPARDITAADVSGQEEREKAKPQCFEKCPQWLLRKDKTRAGVELWQPHSCHAIGTISILKMSIKHCLALSSNDIFFYRYWGAD